MKLVLTILLCLMLMGCQLLPQTETGSEINVATATEPVSPLSPYTSFFQELLSKPMSDIMTPIFIDYKELPNAFTLSVALVELTGDELPEVLIAYTSDVPNAAAQTYTQIYRLSGDKLEPWGSRLPMTMTFYGLNQLFGTAEQLVGKQLNRSYIQYQITPELLRVAEGNFSVIADQSIPTQQAGLDQLATLARTMVVGSQPEDLLIMAQAVASPPLVLFNEKSYDQTKLQALATNFDLRFINWKKLDQAYINNLVDYAASAGRAQVSTRNRDTIDLEAQRIDSHMTGGQVLQVQIDGNRYFYLSDLSVRGMQHFRLIKAQMGEQLVYFQVNQPIKIVQAEKVYYPSDTDQQSLFISVQQRMRADLSRHLFRRFLLLDAYDLAVPYEDYQLDVIE